MMITRRKKARMLPYRKQWCLPKNSHWGNIFIAT